MAKGNLHTSRLRKVDPRWFTGRTELRDAGSAANAGSGVYSVTFYGSRTKLHRHNGEQVLVALSGSGSLELFRADRGGRQNFAIKKTKTVPLKSGDVVSIPAGTLHTHGSVGGRFTHIAINMRRNFGTVWYESDSKNAGRIIR